jgi:hypothetical protein
MQAGGAEPAVDAVEQDALLDVGGAGVQRQPPGEAIGDLCLAGPRRKQEFTFTGCHGGRSLTASARHPDGRRHAAPACLV